MMEMKRKCAIEKRSLFICLFVVIIYQRKFEYVKSSWQIKQKIYESESHRILNV